MMSTPEMMIVKYPSSAMTATMNMPTTTSEKTSLFFLLISMSPSCLSQGPYRSTLMRRGAVRACTAGSYIASTATPGAMKSPELTTRTA